MKKLFAPAGFLQKFTSHPGRVDSSPDPLSEDSIRALIQPHGQALHRLQQGFVPTLDGSFERDALTDTKARAADVTARRRKLLADIHARLIAYAGQINAESAVRAQVTAEIERAQQLLDRLWIEHSHHVRAASQDASEAHVQYDAFRAIHGLSSSAPAVPPLLQQDCLWLRLPFFILQFLVLFAIEMKLNIWSVREVMDGRNYLQESAILSTVAIMPLWLLGFFITPLVIRCIRHRRWDLKAAGLSLMAAALSGVVFHMNVSTYVRGEIFDSSRQSYQVITGGSRTRSPSALPGSTVKAAPKSPSLSTPLLNAVKEVRGMSWWIPQIEKGDFMSGFFFLVYSICLGFAGWKGVIFFGRSSYFGYWQVEKRKQDTALAAHAATEQWSTDLRALVTSFDGELDQMYLQISVAHASFAELNEKRRDLVARHNLRISQLPAMLRSEHESYLGIALSSLKRRSIVTRRGRGLHTSADEFAPYLLHDHAPGEDLCSLDARVLGIHAIIESARGRIIALEAACFARMREFCQQIDHLWEAGQTSAPPAPAAA